MSTRFCRCRRGRWSRGRVDERKILTKNKKTVLIVDDDPVQVKLLKDILMKNGFETHVTLDAADGLQYAMRNQPAFIILDVMMPVINGYNFCKLLKKESKQCESAIIMVTARDEMEDIQIGMDMGADAYLTKPVQTVELLKTLQVVQSMDHSQE